MNRWARGPIFTIGRSTRTLAQFVALLREENVTRLVDVRAIPRSRRTPQFNADTLPDSLAAEGIAYRHLPDLGGRRHHRPTASNPRHSFRDEVRQSRATAEAAQ